MRRALLWSPVVALAAAAVTLSACSSSTSGSPAAAGSSGPVGASTSVSSSSAPSSPASSPESTSSSAAATGRPVHIKLLEDDEFGPVTYGVGMPIVAYFSRRITDAAAFSTATTVTVNGKPANGAWYFERSRQIAGYPIEAHYRPAPRPGENGLYWPAHATISMDMATKGVSAGKGLVFDDSLTLRMRTGAAHISTVDCAPGVETMKVYSDGKLVHRMSTSCGAAQTPTYTGIKVVMQKGEDAPGTDRLRPQGAVEMIGTGSDHYDLIVPWSVRITASGEYVHAASWNGGNIGIRSTSNGCTNLNVGAAEWFYHFANIGDVVTYTHTGGSPMPTWDGFGDWNVPWSQWRLGGIVPSS